MVHSRSSGAPFRYLSSKGAQLCVASYGLRLSYSIEFEASSACIVRAAQSYVLKFGNQKWVKQSRGVA